MIGKHGYLQVNTIVAIRILAVVRKHILLEIENTSGLFLLALGSGVLSLGIVFALFQWIEWKDDTPNLPSPGTPMQPR